jgi:hypothetical protein
VGSDIFSGSVAFGWKRGCERGRVCSARPSLSGHGSCLRHKLQGKKQWWLGRGDDLGRSHASKMRL